MGVGQNARVNEKMGPPYLFVEGIAFHSLSVFPQAA